MCAPLSTTNSFSDLRIDFSGKLNLKNFENFFHKCLEPSKKMLVFCFLELGDHGSSLKVKSGFQNLS